MYTISRNLSTNSLENDMDIATDPACVFADHGCVSSCRLPRQEPCHECLYNTHPYLLRKIRDTNPDRQKIRKDIMAYHANPDKCISRRSRYFDQEWMTNLMALRQGMNEILSERPGQNQWEAYFTLDRVECDVWVDEDSLCSMCIRAVIEDVDLLDAEWYTKVFKPNGQIRSPLPEEVEVEVSEDSSAKKGKKWGLRQLLSRH